MHELPVNLLRKTTWMARNQSEGGAENALLDTRISSKTWKSILLSDVPDKDHPFELISMNNISNQSDIEDQKKELPNL